MSAQTHESGPAPSDAPTGWEQRPDSGAHPMPPVGHPAEAVKDALSKLAELREFVAYYVAARIDALKLTLRNIGIMAALGVVGLIAAAALVVVSVVLLLLGISGAWAELFPTHRWLGDLITGALFLLIVAGAILIGLRILSSSMRRSTVQKYEKRQRQQRQQFGRDVRHEASISQPDGPAAQRAAGKAD